MNSRVVRKIIVGLLSCFSFCFFNNAVSASEVDSGIVIVDRKPWKISWIQESQEWVLIANFEKGVLRTFFKDEPPAKGFGLSRYSKPLKQEFEFYFGKKFTSTNCQYEQWPDGAKAYAFTYQQKFERDGKKFEFGTTAVIEEVGDAENEIRYSIFRVYE